MGSKDGLSISGAGGDSVEVRHLPEGGGEEARRDDGGHGNRVRVQLDHREHSAGPDPVPFALLLSFTRHLIREQCGSDAMILAMYAARREQGATEEQMQLLLKAVMKEHATYGLWPKGF